MRRDAFWWVWLLPALLLGCASLAPAPFERVAYLAFTDGYWQVWLMTPEGWEAQPLTSSPYDKTRVSWFPDGAELLVNSVEGRLFRVALRDGSEVPLELRLQGMLDAVVSPDGGRIAFSLNAAAAVDETAIWVVNVDGSELRRLTQMPGLQHQPRWSPDGEWIYFLSSSGPQGHDIWRVSTKTGSREQLTVGALYHFEVAPAGRGRLAFSSNRSGDYELWVWDYGHGKPAVQLTDHPGLDGDPAWAPDGSALLFTSARSGALNIWRVSPRGKGLRQLTHHAEGARAPAWWRSAGGGS